MDKKGYTRAGYKYLILDDCWQSPSRMWDLDMKQRLYPDYKRFPNMASLVQSVRNYIFSFINESKQKNNN